MSNFSLEFKGCLPDKNLSMLAFLAFKLPASASINHLTRPKKFVSDTPPNVGTLQDMVDLSTPLKHIVALL